MSEQTTPVEERVAEPKAVVTKDRGHVSKRKEISKRFDLESPGYVHLWMDSATPVEELEMAGYQKAKWPEGKSTPESLRGKVVQVKKDILCRVPKDVFNAERKRGEDLSRTLVEQSMRGKDDEDLKFTPRNLVRKPKDARDIGKPAN
jgi:hypothetical protein